MRKYIFAIATAAVITSMGCHADRTKNDRKSTGADSSLQDSSRLDSFGGDGTAKSRKGTTKDSTVMGTPPD